MQFPSISPYPVGIRFHPTDTELVGFYLYNKIVAPSLLFGNNWVRDFPLLLDCSDNVAESSYSSSAGLSNSGYTDHLLLDSSDNVIMSVEIGEIAAESSSTVVVAVPIQTKPSIIEADRYINLDEEEIVTENGVNLAQSSPRGIADENYFTLDDLNNLLCFDDPDIVFFTDQMTWL
ncbi:hypothetical protein ACOSQ2_027457 [Xanthoceras sorbifolium]